MSFQHVKYEILSKFYRGVIEFTAYRGVTETIYSLL